MCGRPVSWYERLRRGDREYLIAAHYRRVELPGGARKREVKKCYLGPVDGYAYTTRTHAREGLVLRGMGDRARIPEYLDALMEWLEGHMSDPGALGLSAPALRRMAARMRGLADELEELAGAA